MLKKIITYFIILAVILPILAVVVPFGGSVKRAYAESSNKPPMTDPCDLFGAGSVGMALLNVSSRIGKAGLNLIDNEYLNKLDDTTKVKTSPSDVSMWNCVAYTTTYLLYDLVMQNAIRLAGLASGLFNVSIQFSLTSEVFDASKNIMISDGWAMIRDLFNLIFIFVLLYAAIATILQYGNMDIKKILPGLIVAALLVNFSLMISKVVIDASHVFSWEFYNQIDATDGNEHPNMENDINVNGSFERKNLANVFLAGFNPQSLLTGKVKKTETTDDKGNKVITEENVESEWYNVVGYARKEGETFTSTLSRMALIILMETALAIFSAFILLVVATMFIARIVILWMVMIFSPIAFVGMILPSMNKYSKMWWDYLINQSFFAPAFLFMFMLSTKFVNSEMMAGLLNITKNGDISLATGMDGGGIISTFLHFGIVAILMFGSLYVAKLLGGKSAELAEKGRNLAFGGANFAFHKTGARVGSRWLGGKAGDAILEGKGRVSGVLKSIPGVSIGLRKLGAMKKADEDKTRKAGEKYAGTLSGAGRTSLDKDKGRGFFGRTFYGGGFFKPTREGYEKIIAKKRADKYEEEKYRDNLAILAEVNDGKDSSGNFIKREAVIKKMLDKGEEERLDKMIEVATNKIEEKFTKGADALEMMITKIGVNLEEKRSELYEAKKNGLPQADVDVIKNAIVKMERQKSGLKGQEVIMEKKREARKTLEKSVEKYEAKQENEKLGAKIGGAGGGSGGGKPGGGGGGKKTP